MILVTLLSVASNARAVLIQTVYAGAFPSSDPNEGSIGHPRVIIFPLTSEFFLAADLTATIQNNTSTQYRFLHRTPGLAPPTSPLPPNADSMNFYSGPDDYPNIPTVPPSPNVTAVGPVVSTDTQLSARWQGNSPQNSIDPWDLCSLRIYFTGGPGLTLTPGGPIVATVQGSLTFQGEPTENFSFNVYEVPEPAVPLSLAAAAVAALGRRRPYRAATG